MNAKRAWLVGVVGVGLLSLSVPLHAARSAEGAAAAQNHKPVMITRFFTGPDGLTHVEKVEAKFVPGGGNDVYKLLENSGAVLRRSPPGRENDYHTASRRQYVITLSGHGELVLSGGQTISVGPGDIELAEDTTGKGHITRTVGTEDRVSIAIPVSDH
jgi:hypothetical protein